jgi:hypothetical protein
MKILGYDAVRAEIATAMVLQHEVEGFTERALLVRVVAAHGVDRCTVHCAAHLLSM